jgi:DNA-binding transcriptional MerR regulator
MPSSTYSISELAREFDLTTRAIRFYEDKGLLAPGRSGAGGLQRVYSARDRARLTLTLRAKRLGLSLTQAKDILDMYDSPRDTVPQLEKFLGVLGTHRAQLEAQLTELQANLAEVCAHEKKGRATLVKAQKASKASKASKATKPMKPVKAIKPNLAGKAANPPTRPTTSTTLPTPLTPLKPSRNPKTAEAKA